MNHDVDKLDNLYDIKSDLLTDVYDLSSYFDNKYGFTIFYLHNINY